MLKGYHSPCSYCGSEINLKHYDFALMQVESTKRNFTETLASAAISAAAIPLVGAGLLYMPGKSFSGHAFHLKLVVCDSCAKQNSNFFGAYVMNEEKATHHPAWKDLYDQGYTKFLAHEKMPDDFRINIGQHL